jgi:hypothetical protein
MQKNCQKMSSLSDLIESSPVKADKDCGWSPKNIGMEATFGAP